MSHNLVKEKTCAFTGHRVIEDEIDLELLDGHIGQLVEEGVTTFLCGMAMGFDLLAAERTLAAKEKNAQIKLIACIPCPGQQKKFPADERKKYEKIIARCDDVLLLSEKYFNGCMFARDRFMVENAEYVIAYRRKNRGGTYYTLKYALSLNRRILFE